MRIYTGLVALLLMALLATPAMAQKLYRWVDKDGNVHYSDQVPPDEIDQAREELNEKGKVIETVDEAASAADLEALGEEAERLRTEQALLELQIAKDRQIEASYADEEAIIRSRERKLGGINLAIRNSTAFIESQADSLNSLQKRKTKVESDGGKVSDAFQSMLDDLDRQITQQQAVLETKTREHDELVGFYDKELASYRAMLKRKEQRESGS